MSFWIASSAAAFAYFTQNLIQDPYHNVVVCGIPKNGITSIRTLLNDRCNRTLALCGACTSRCAEFKFNPKWHLDKQTQLVVMFRDPYTRFLSAYNDRNANPYIRIEFLKIGVDVTNMMFYNFTLLVHHNWAIVSKNEHFTPQTTLCQPDRQNYSFMGSVNRASDEHHFWKKLLNASKEVHVHQAKQAGTQSLTMDANHILRRLYRNDYEFFLRAGLN